MAHHKKRVWPIWLIGGVLVLLLGVWVVQSLMAQSDSSPEKSQANTTKLENVRPQFIETNDAFTRYVQSATSGDVNAIRENDIYYAQDVDWNTEGVVAIKFSLFNTKSVTGAGIEKIDGEDSYVIDVLDAPNCGSSIQIDTTRLAFIKQTSREASLPVILRTTPNTATCDILQ